jgi:flavin-dependent dehydrogenase
VWEIEFPIEKSNPVKILYGRKGQSESFEADLVVGAFGVNTYLMRKIRNLNFGYRPPRTKSILQAEINLGKEVIDGAFGNTIHVYMPKAGSLKFAVVIPKGHYISITLIGRKNSPEGILQKFYELEEIKQKLPKGKPHCFCYPKITISSSKNPFFHRFVVIGDAGFSRQYKNGIESAFFTARLAAKAAVFSGIHRSAFKRAYYKKAKKYISRDNTFGRFLFMLNDLISRIPLLTRVHLTLLQREKTSYSSKKLKSILWNMFTGNIPYKEIFLMSLDIRLQLTILWTTIDLIFSDIKKVIAKR